MGKGNNPFFYLSLMMTKLEKPAQPFDSGTSFSCYSCMKYWLTFTAAGWDTLVILSLGAAITRYVNIAGTLFLILHKQRLNDSLVESPPAGQVVRLVSHLRGRWRGIWVDKRLEGLQLLVAHWGETLSLCVWVVKSFHTPFWFEKHL